MGETILLALLFVALIILLAYQNKKNRDAESHLGWIFELRECIHSIERRFNRECEKIITDAFSARNVKGEIIIDDFWKSITELKNEYANNLYEKVVAQKGKYGIKSVPEYLESEYKRNISDIADTYRYFGDFMAEQIKETRRRYLVQLY